MRIVISCPAGGPSDGVARTLGRALNQSTGQPVVIDNRPGANGVIAAQTVLAARPDGYTLLWGIGSMPSIPLLYKKPPFESFTEFSPVATVGDFPFGLFINTSVPATTADGLIKHARSAPNSLNYASATLSEYMAAALFLRTAGIQMTRVSYKGSTQAVPDLVAGRVQLYVTPATLALPHAKEGRLRMLATLLPQRLPAAPEVPTMSEIGMPGVSVPTWQALFGPPKLPPQIATTLSDLTQRAVHDPEVRVQLERLMLQPRTSTPQQLTAALRDNINNWRTFIRDNDIPLE